MKTKINNRFQIKLYRLYVNFQQINFVHQIKTIAIRMRSVYRKILMNISVSVIQVILIKVLIQINQVSTSTSERITIITLAYAFYNLSFRYRKITQKSVFF